MPINLEQKKAIVTELVGVAKNSISAIAADYCGLTVSEMTELRKSAREKQGIVLRVYRNTLARRALKDTAFACLEKALVGPMILIFSQEEPGGAARLIRDFIKTNEKLSVKALALDGELLGPDQLKAIADLPSLDEALGLLAAVMQAPVTQFVRTLNEPVAQFGRVMGQIRDQKEQAAA